MTSPRSTIPYSFSLSQRAAKIIDSVRGRKKSAMVSRAIVWFFTHESDPKSHAELLERYNEQCIRVLNLEKELGEVSSPSEIANDEAKDVPQSRGIWYIFHKIWPF